MTSENSYRRDLKEKVVFYASQAFRRDGIRRVTMDAIAAALGISKRTLYEIFNDKESLLIAVILRSEEEDRKFTEEIIRESGNVMEIILRYLMESVKYLQDTNRQVFVDMKKYPKAYALRNEIKRRKDAKNIEMYRRGVDEGVFRNDVNFEILTLLVNEQFDLLLHTDVCNEYSFVEVFESISFTFIRGIATEKGARMMEEYLTEYRAYNGAAV